MSDLISRQDAIRWLKTEWDRMVTFVFDEIEQLPSATCDDCIWHVCNYNKIDWDAQPKTGRWIKATGMMPPEFHGHHCCSECGNFANMEPPFGNREELSKFCPNCGAKMYREDSE